MAQKAIALKPIPEPIEPLTNAPPAKIYPFYSGGMGEEPVSSDEKKSSWWERRLQDLRLKEMANTPPRSPWNPTMVTMWCAVLTLIGGLVLSLVTLGVFVGIAINKQATMEERLKAAEEDSKKAVQLEASRSGHPPEKQEGK